MTTADPRHRCSRCGGGLARDNDGAACSACAAEAPDPTRPPHVPDEFWQTAAMREALASRHIGRVIRSYRVHPYHGRHPIPQTTAASWLRITQTKLSHVENGPPTLHLDKLYDWARILRIPQRHLWFALPQPALSPDFGASGTEPSGQPEPQHITDAEGQPREWLHRPDFLPHIAKLVIRAHVSTPLHERVDGLVPDVRPEPPRKVGLTDVTRIEATTCAFRDWDNRWGGGLSRAAVIAQLEWVVATAKDAICSSEAVKARLLVALADLAGVAAFLSYDVNHHAEARSLWMLGLDASTAADNPDLAGATLRQLAHQSLHLDRPDEALRLLRLAYATTADPEHHTSELALAEIAAYEGWSYAAGGKPQPCHRALGKAQEHFDNARDEEPPPWLAHLDLAELTALRGHCYHVLAYRVPDAASQAETLLREAIAGRDLGYARSKTLNLIALSATYFQRADGIEEGAAIGQHALDGAETLTSPRALDRLRALDTLTAPYADTSVVAEFRHRLDQVLTHA